MVQHCVPLGLPLSRLEPNHEESQHLDFYSADLVIAVMDIF